MSENVCLLQKYLKKNSWDAFMVPRTDEYLSEYVAPYAERLKWISGFSGSAGIAVILQEKAAIFTDGRYELQIAEQVNDKFFSIHNIKDFDTWIVEHFSYGFTLAIDSWLFSRKMIENIKIKLKGQKIKIHYVDKTPIDLLWTKQPKKPFSKVFLHELRYAGENSHDKIIKIKNNLEKQKCDYFFITALDSIAWILNLRGSDIEYTPLNLAYLMISTNSKAILYSDLKKFDSSVKSHLSSNVDFVGYELMKKKISKISKSSIVGIDENKTPYWFINQLNKINIKLKIINDPCYIYKAIKNPIELNGARKANIRDGVSVTKFLYWLKKEIVIENISEYSALEKLYELRKNNKFFFSLSFHTISAIGAHAALPHYRVTKNNNAQFSKNNIYLVDSGAQYLDGTTDITRTIILGESSDEQKDRFTRVLKGHIALAVAKFDKNTRGSEIDYIARKSLQEINCDYNHGTGHGIGSFLGVHEGPQRIYKSKKHKDAYLEPGMILSNEPGFYKTNEYGIRIENLVIIVKDKNNKLTFETISWAPIDRDLILVNQLNYLEKKWIDEYHNKVYANIARYLTIKEKGWLKKVTQPL